MKAIKILFILAGGFLPFSCTDWNYIDTGIHDPNQHINQTMYSYLSENTKQFYLTTALIERAGLRNLFEGKDASHHNIMFIAPGKYAVMAGMIRKGYAKTVVKDKDGKLDFDYLKDIENIPVDVCKSIILSYTFDKIYLRDEFPEGRRGEGPEFGEGGEVLTSINGNKIWFYRQKTAYGNFTDVPVNTIIGIEVDSKTDLYLQTTDIKVKNGVVHGNVNGFIIKDLK